MTIEASTIATAEALPVHRRLGRRALRLLRPLAAPLLHRMEMRMRGAMDRSDAGRATARLEASVAALAGRLDAVSAELSQRHAQSVAPGLAAIPHRLDALEDRLAGVELRAEALQLGTRGLAALPARTEQLLGAVGTLTHQAAGRLSALEEGVATLGARSELLVRSGGQAADRLSKLEEGVAGLGTRSELLVQFGELLLQRNILPLGDEIAVRTDAGYLLVPKEDVGLLVALVETRGRLEPGTLKVVQDRLHEGGTMIDVGANVGSLAVPAARRVGPSGRVIAVEPTPRVAELLRRTAALNELSDRLVIEQCAAGEAESQAAFGLSAETTHNSLVPAEGSSVTIQVPVRPLDALVAPGTRVDLVKIDAEGAELRVWRGMRRIVAENPGLAAIVEFGPSHLRRTGTTVEEWFAELQAPGFVAREIDEATGETRPLRGGGLDEVFSLNLLLLRDPPSGGAGRRPA